MRCYNYYGFGYKAQDYWKPRRQPTRNTPYQRKSNKAWKKSGYEGVETLRTDDGNQGYLQKWMARTINTNIIEIDGTYKEVAEGFHLSCTIYKISQNP